MKNKERITETLSGNMKERMGEQIKKMERGETSKVAYLLSFVGRRQRRPRRLRMRGRDASVDLTRSWTIRSTNRQRYRLTDSK